MREIIFRGKRVDNGEWVEGGSLLQFLMIGGCKKMSIAPRGTKPHIKKDGQVIQAEEIFPETVGQYTGLTDKNGTRIFEGDIISAHFDDIFPERETRLTVCWYDYGWHGKTKYRYATLEYDWVNEYFEVIGNIHDNPELLKGE